MVDWKTHYIGTVKAFILGKNDKPAIIIELDGKAVFGKIQGKYLVFELRYVRAEWKEIEMVHVELCDFVPEDESWKDRKQGEWVESHARYKKL